MGWNSGFCRPFGEADGGIYATLLDMYMYVYINIYIYTYTIYIYTYIEKKGLATKNPTDLAWW